MFFTRKGDAGTSKLFCGTERISKNSPVFGALGTLDELTSLLGACRARAERESAQYQKFNIHEELLRAQQCLCIALAELAGAKKSIPQERVSEIEHTIGAIEETVGNPNAFVIPGATELSGLLDYARALSRRAERAVLEIHPEREVSESTRMYLNRLSSLLYALARYAASTSGLKEITPSY
ncbi:MAG TPA: cob(I)yrinic acid a,c-diamide adenosyltransferase [Candidatus Paceibacterota bacterium]